MDLDNRDHLAQVTPINPLYNKIMKRLAPSLLMFGLCVRVLNIEAAITNGIVVEAGQFPQVTKVLVNGLDKCTGTLVGVTTILTAAHCFKELSGKNISISIAGKAYAVTDFFLHPKYKSLRAKEDELKDKLFSLSHLSTPNEKQAARKLLAEYENGFDLAVIKLGAPAQLVDPIPIRVRSPSYFYDLPATLIGYGVTSLSLGSRGLGVKRMGTNQVLFPWEKFLVAAGHWDNEEPQTNGKRAGMADGDSGGPLFDGPCIIGVSVDTIDSPFDTIFLETLTDTEKSHWHAETGLVPNLFISLSDPEIIDFLHLAEIQGYDIAWE